MKEILRFGALLFCLSAFAADPDVLENSTAQTELAKRLQLLCQPAGGIVGVNVTHVETAQTVSLQGKMPLPMCSVFKLPVAILILKQVEEKRLSLEQEIHITPDEVTPGWKGNTDLWQRPVDCSIRQLLELSLMRSDNTACDQLIELLGGPATVNAQMKALGFSDIEILASVKQLLAVGELQNKASADALVRLLISLQKGDILQPSSREILLGMMTKTTTGLHRLRGELPAGTVVADKTGTGPDGSSTNDVGIITLPGEKGHLAMAVLINGSKLSPEAQEKLIADLARTAYDAFLATDRTN